MQAEPTKANQMPTVGPRLFLAVGPMLLIAMGYIDPGKWAAAVEGAAAFGFDLILPVLVFSFTAILCQYLAARIGVVTGKNLAQICREEYSKPTCILLGVQAEVSMIALDLTMILGIAHGLNLLFGVDLFTCVILTAFDAVLFPLLTTLLEKCKAEVFFWSIAGFVFSCYVLGGLISQPEISFVVNAMPTRLSGETAFALMSLLGANIVPHNFYLHSSIVQGILDPAFSKPRSPVAPCFCLQISAAHAKRPSPVMQNELLPPTVKPGRGKCTNTTMLLEMIKDVEIALSCRKGRSGTAAGDVAYPKGKENLASVLKRYKRRLSNKSFRANDCLSGSRKVYVS